MAVVPAAGQALDVLSYLARQAGPVPAATISRDVGVPRSSTYHLLDTLCRAGFVTHFPDERRYGLGLAAYELGTGYSRQAPLQRLARVPLATLVDRTGCSGHLAVLHGSDVVYVLEERARHLPSLVTDVGVRLPAHLTASGRAILAATPAAQLRALLPERGELALRTGVGPRTVTELRTVVQQARRRGYAVERGDVTHGFASVAVAVLDHAGYPAAAVAVTYRDDERVGEDVLAARVRRTAREIGRRLGAGSSPTARDVGAVQ